MVKKENVSVELRGKNYNLLPVMGHKKKSFKVFKDNLELLLLTMPALACFIIFNYLPIFGIVLAFKKYSYSSGILRSPWVGFDNFKFFFTSQDVWRITRNTVSYSFVFIVLGTLFAISVALLLFEIKSRLACKIYQTVMILPKFLSWVVIGFITYALFNPTAGVLNQFLTAIGLQPVQWYTTIQYWPFILVIVNIWNGVGMSCIMYYAALMGIDESLYEAATIDGANRWQQTIHISIPSLIPLIIILNILAIGGLFRGDFGLFYQIPRDIGALYPVTDIIDTYVFRGLTSGDIGRTTAIGLFQSFMGLILVVTTNAVVKKIDPEKSIF